MPARELSALLRLSGTLAASLELVVIMQTAIESATEALGLDMGVVYLLRDGELFLEAASPPLPDGLPDEHRRALLDDHPHLSRCLHEVRPVIVEDVRLEELSPAERVVVESADLRSAVFAPLAVEGRALGAFIVHTVGRVRRFSDHDAMLCEALSRQISLAVANAQLFQDVRQSNTELERYRQHLEELVELRTREIGAVNAELDAANEELQAANEELIAANEELDRVAREAVRANVELEEATHAKSAFLANMSHELRTPLNSIIGFADMLREELAGPLNREQRVQIGMIAESGRQLLGLIEDVLDLSKVEAGRVEVVARDFDGAALVRDVIEASRSLVTARDLTLALDAPEVPCMMCSDSRRVRQVLVNLIGNAIKFTVHGEVRIGVTCSGVDLVSFTVADTGRGIARSDLVRIFDAFTQVGDSTEGRAQGTGLGLTLSREYAALLGGELTAVSEPGVGSTFTLTIPRHLPEACRS